MLVRFLPVNRSPWLENVNNLFRVHTKPMKTYPACNEDEGLIVRGPRHSLLELRRVNQKVNVVSRRPSVSGHLDVIIDSVASNYCLPHFSPSRT